MGMSPNNPTPRELAYERSACHSRSKRTWSATAPRPATRAPPPVGDPERLPLTEVELLLLRHARARVRQQPRPAGEGGARLVRRAVAIGRSERQHLAPA